MSGDTLLWIGAALAALIAAGHILQGPKLFLGHMFSAYALTDLERIFVFAGWHAISVVLLVNIGASVAVAQEWLHADAAIAAALASLGVGLAYMASGPVNGVSAFKLPYPYLYVVIGLLILFGAMTFEASFEASVNRILPN